MQLALDLNPRQIGESAGESCAAKAKLVASFDTAGAGKFIEGWLRRHGELSGESLTEAAKAHGYRPHDDRAMGPVFAKLARDKRIRCVGFCTRKNGHGTAGGRIWAAT